MQIATSNIEKHGKKYEAILPSAIVPPHRSIKRIVINVQVELDDGTTMQVPASLHASDTVEELEQGMVDQVRRLCSAAKRAYDQGVKQ